MSPCYNLKLHIALLKLGIAEEVTRFIGIYRGADKSLGRPGKKQATVTKLLQATQKKFRMLSVRSGLRSSNDLRVGRKMVTFQWFFSVESG